MYMEMSALGTFKMCTSALAIHLNTHTHTHKHARTHKHTHTHTHTHAHAHIYIYIYIYIYNVYLNFVFVGGKKQHKSDKSELKQNSSPTAAASNTHSKKESKLHYKTTP